MTSPLNIASSDPKGRHGLDLKALSTRIGRQQKQFVWALMAAWTLLLVGWLWAGQYLTDQAAREMALAQARTLLAKDLLYRQWNSELGGVYVPITPHTPPNPYLDVPNREATTTEGLDLTLINPAYMTRLVYQIQAKRIGISARITSLKPINPINRADDWERTGLESLELGSEEYSALIENNGQAFMRLLIPMKTEANCLRCHARQGYRVGDVRGGLSVAVPMAPFQAALRGHMTGSVTLGLISWAAGLVVILAGYFYLQRSEKLRVRAEEEIRLLSRAVRQSPASVVITDTSGLIEYVNPKFTEVTGYSLDEALGRNPRILKSGLQPPEIYRQLWETITTGREWRGELQNRKKDGALYWEYVSISPVTSPEGGVTHFLAVKEDVTERKRAEEELRTAKEAAESANRAKSEFLANMSHEIRTPMNGIIGMTHLALETGLNKEQREYLELIQAAAENLEVLLNDILDFSKIEAGRLELRPVVFGLRETLEGALRTLEVKARAKGLRLSWEADEEAPDDLLGDPDRLRQVLINLVGNAVKFTDRGGVAVTVGLERAAGPDIELGFQVRDTGPGIAEGDRERIFSAFTQADGSTTRRFGGTGLGLAISSQLVAMFGGRIWVESEIGRGSTFCFTARFNRPERSAPGENAATESKAAPAAVGCLAPESGIGQRILVAEDNPINQRLAERVLARAGYEVVLADSGRAALEAWKDRTFDLILMDIQMPELDGLGATAAIREREDLEGGHTPIVALTAYAMKGDQDRFLQAGMDGYLAKPIRPQVLLAKVAEMLGCPPPASPSDENETEAPEASGPAFDYQVLCNRCGGDQELINEMIALFLEELPQRLDEIRSALESSDRGRLERAAHSLKGGIGYFTTNKPWHLADTLVDMARRGDLAGADATASDLQRETARLKSALQAVSRQT